MRHHPEAQPLECQRFVKPLLTSGGFFPQKGLHPPGNGDTPMIRACENRTTTNTTSASAMRQSSAVTRRARPEAIAPNGMLEVRAANASHASPIFRLRLASIETVPASASTRNVPKKITEASSPLAAV